MDNVEWTIFAAFATLTAGVIGVGEEAIRNRLAPQVMGRAVTETGVHNVVAQSDFLDAFRDGKIVVVERDNRTIIKGMLKTTDGVSYLVMEDGTRYVYNGRDYNGRDYLKVQK